ncbi:SRPBCC domain-containing protein [Streptomyces verrucosisporus]|uniref:SRPBCC family protein n=1 Tax=Streptomyces verrucosisporus TaxID=1695161 RepID=UPI0019D1F0B5|nr:SRPBCC domain-containing protein [Streptomyces verrucosisporus]MBN3933112.1 SRPBCC domain-containing protein [Streptomyces verrucosisporus]
MTQTTSLNEIAITRVFDAPRAELYRAWTEPERFAQWWGPRGFATDPSTVSLDVRSGGEWKATMASEEAGEFPFAGVYREVVENERLVFSTIDLNDDDTSRDGGTDELTTVTFADRDGGTEMTFRQLSRLEADKTEEAREGWKSFFDCLEEHLAKS